MDRIVWSENAKSNLKQILIYWKTKNKSDRYSEKLRVTIHQRIDQLLIFAEMGTATNFGNVRTLVVGKNFRIFYELSKSSIIIHAIWDVRQNPEGLKNRFK